MRKACCFSWCQALSSLSVDEDVIWKKVKNSLHQGDDRQYALLEKKTFLSQMCSNLLYNPINLKHLEMFEKPLLKEGCFHFLFPKYESWGRDHKAGHCAFPKFLKLTKMRHNTGEIQQFLK